MAASTPRLLLNSVLRWNNSSQAIIRNSSYLSSPKVRPAEEYPEVQVTQDPAEWKFVERLLPTATIPKPVPKAEFPSGWKPPQPKADSKYTVSRTKNHMIPVYLAATHRGERRLTVVRYVQGDIWALEQDLRALIEKARNGRRCASQVNEMSRQIRFHGDYVDLVREYLKKEGF